MDPLSDCRVLYGSGQQPLYLQTLERNLSMTQNVDNLFFAQNAPLAREYDFLFRSLFNEAIVHRQIIETLASKVVGMTRMEIIAAAKLKMYLCCKRSGKGLICLLWLWTA